MNIRIAPLLLSSITVNSRYLEVDGSFFYKFKWPEVQINLHFGLFELVKKSQTPNYGGESNQNVIFILIDASSFAEFDISEFEISRIDCISAQFGDSLYTLLIFNKRRSNDRNPRILTDVILITLPSKESNIHFTVVTHFYYLSCESNRTRYSFRTQFH